MASFPYAVCFWLVEVAPRFGRSLKMKRSGPDAKLCVCRTG
jgi:hypothetical protein